MHSTGIKLNTWNMYLISITETTIDFQRKDRIGEMGSVTLQHSLNLLQRYT